MTTEPRTPHPEPDDLTDDERATAYALAALARTLDEIDATIRAAATDEPDGKAA